MKLTGKNVYVELGAFDISPWYRSLDFKHSQNSVEVTAGADEYDNFAATTKMASATLEVIVDNTWTPTQKAILYPGFEGDFNFGEEGNGTGKPKTGFNARVKDASRKAGYKDAFLMTLELEIADENGLLYDGITDTY